MYEWLLWTGVIMYSLMIVYWIFRFDLIIVLVARSSSAWACWSGSGSSGSRRSSRAYERQLAKQRYFSRERFSHPETTIRTKSSRRRRRRR